MKSEQNQQTDNLKQGETMKCVKIIGPKAIEVCIQKKPKPGPGEILIKVMAAPINPSDLELYNGNYGHQKKIPTIWGFEGSGIVVQNGGGMMGWGMVGKKVAFAIDKEGFGSYSQYSIAKVTQCLPLTGDTSLQEGSMSLVNPLTAMAMLQIVKGRKQNCVLLTAAASALCKMMNRLFASNGVDVINVVRRKEQVETLQKQGAKYILNSSDQNFEEKLKQITQKMNCRTCYEAIGGKTTGIMLKNMPKNSVVTVYGCLSHEDLQDVSVMELLVNNKKVDGFLLPNYLKSKSQMSLLPMLYKVRNSMTKGLKSHVTKRFSLDDAQKAIEYYLSNMSEGKVLFKPWGEQQQEPKK